MENNMIKVKSASDWTLVVSVPYLSLHRRWEKRGQIHLIDRQTMVHAYYDAGVESLVSKGALIIEDVEFLRNVGLLDEETNKSVVYELTDAMKTRLIKVMPLQEVASELSKMSQLQIAELADYAITNYTELKMDRIDLLSKTSGKNIMRAIELYRASQEG